MQLRPKPTQISGAEFLAARVRAALIDEPRVGKTGAAIIAADLIFAQNILVITTSSGRPVWRRAWRTWSVFPRAPYVQLGTLKSVTDGVVIVSWGAIKNARIRIALSRAHWDLVIVDESHYAKSLEAVRTTALYGDFHELGEILDARNAVLANAAVVWALTGTPIPNWQNDLYPMLRALFPDLLKADPLNGWPDVTTYPAFVKRYCAVKRKKIAAYRWIPAVVGSKNTDELRARLNGIWLRRTQADVGIQAPVYETLPLIVTAAMLRQAEGQVDKTAILAAAEAGETKALEMHMGPLRRLTGDLKAPAVIEYVREQFEGGLDKIVLMAWHKDVVQVLADGLAEFGVLTLDGSTPPARRGELEQRFLNDPKSRVFVGQIQAAGEAIDLSAAALLIFVETSFTPKDMLQAALRITNHGQTRQAFVLVATLEGSIDEALQGVLMRKWTSIREVLPNA